MPTYNVGPGIFQGTNLDDEFIVDLAGLTTIDARRGNNTIRLKSAAELGPNSLEVTAGNGDDRVVNEAGGRLNSAILNLGNGNNTVNIAGNSATVTTGNGKDIINVSAGNVIVDSGAGDDDLNVAGDRVEINAGTGNNKMNVRGGTIATIVAGKGNDVLTGLTPGRIEADLGDGNNIIDFQFGVTSSMNRIKMGSGKDVVKLSNIGFGSIDLGGGDDTIEYNSPGSPRRWQVSVNLGDGNNRLLGSSFGNSIVAGKGNDVIDVGGCRVDVNSGAGNDVINVFAASQRIDAGSGNNVINSIGRSFRDIDGSNVPEVITILAGDGNDRLTVERATVLNVNLGNGKNQMTVSYSKSADLVTGSGNDLIEASLWGEIADVVTKIDAGNGRNTIRYTNDRIDAITNIQAGFGNDVMELVTASRQTFVNAGDGRNTITVKGNAEVVTGNGADTIKFMASEYARVSSGDGNDVIRGSGLMLTNSCEIDAGNGNNLIRAEWFRNQVTSGDGNDVIVAFGHSNEINAGAGNDLVSVSSWTRPGGASADVALGNGNNKATIGTGPGSANMTAGSGNDEISVSGFHLAINAGNGNNQIYAAAWFSGKIVTGSGDDAIYAGGNGALMTIDAGQGNNYIQIIDDYVQFDYPRTCSIKAGNGRDVFAITHRTGTAITIENYNPYDRIVLGKIDDVSIVQAGSDVQIFHLQPDQKKDLNITVKNAKVSDIQLSAGPGRVITDAMRDPFKAALPVLPSALQ